MLDCNISCSNCNFLLTITKVSLIPTIFDTYLILFHYSILFKVGFHFLANNVYLLPQKTYFLTLIIAELMT